MPKPKYNWAELKAEYLAQDDREVMAFLRRKLSLKHTHKTSSMNVNTLGWRKEWEAQRKNIAEKAIKKLEEKKSVDLAEALEDIHYFLKDYAKIARNTRGKNGLAKVDDVKHVWDMLRTENGLPTKITHSKVETVSDPEDAVGKLLEDE